MEISKKKEELYGENCGLQIAAPHLKKGMEPNGIA